MKIYLICLDAYPETDSLKELMNQRKMMRSDLICGGAFTASTFTSIISGCIGTEIIENGIGYNTMYRPQFYSWRKDQCIIERLIDHHYDVRVHNHVPWFSQIIGGKQLNTEIPTHYRNQTVDNDNIETFSFMVSKKDENTKIQYSSTNPEMTLNTFIKWNFPEEKIKFYENEKKHIEYIQEQKFKGLFITDLCHWHECVYYPNGQVKSNFKITQEDSLKSSVEWLSNWNFDEPNSIFLIFADHSHRVVSYLDPQSYATWIYCKNNINSNKLNPIISSLDIYKIIENIFDLPNLSKSKWIANPFNCYDINRIYAFEDSRCEETIKEKATAFGRSFILNDIYVSVVKLTNSTKFPIGIYVIVSSITNKYTYTVYLFENIHESYSDYFSIECKGPLESSNKTKTKIYELNPEIMEKIFKLDHIH